MSNPGMIERPSVLKAAAAFGGLSTLAVIAPAVSGAAQETQIPAAASPEVKLEDVTAGPNTKLTIERRGQIVLIGINRPYIKNRIDPETFEKLAEAYYQYDHDPSHIYFFFGYQKWFDYEAQGLIPFFTHGPLIFWMYPVFGMKSTSWAFRSGCLERFCCWVAFGTKSLESWVRADRCSHSSALSQSSRSCRMAGRPRREDFQRS